MGMASSQARLLMITSRLHDVELRAQQLQNAKLQLSTQQDAAYEEYQEALDATTLTMATINGANTSNLVGTFNSIFALGASRPANMSTNNSGYILLDSRGRVVVEDEVYEGYQNYVSAGGGDMHMNNAYQFAWYMVEGEHDGHYFDWLQPSLLQEAINEVFSEHAGEMATIFNNACEALYEAYGSLDPSDPNHTYVDPSDPNIPSWETGGWWNPTSGTPDFTRVLTYTQWENGHLCNPFTNDQLDAFNTLINYFWSHYGQQVFNKLDEGAANIEGGEYNNQEFNYYVRIYNAIQQHGGCISITDFDGPDGSAANNSEWLTNMIQSGQLYIEIGTVDNQGGFTLDGISVSSDVNLSYTQTTQIDSVALAKAEAKYEHEMKTIDRKDKKFDVELGKLDTERSALTKQVDSIKKVSDDNIERTFGIFS